MKERSGTRTTRNSTTMRLARANALLRAERAREPGRRLIIRWCPHLHDHVVEG